CTIAIINRLRADRFAASSGVSAISLKTLSAIPRLLVPLLGYINVRLRGLLRLLREHVQHMDFAAKLRYIHQPSDASVVSGPYLNSAHSDLGHRLEILRRQTKLHTI